MHAVARLAITLVLAVVVAIPPAMAVTAGPPDPVSEIDDIPAGAACAFPVHAEFSGKEKRIDLPDGSWILTGPAVRVVLTNLDDPDHQLSLSITGAFHQSRLDNGEIRTVATGRNLIRGLILLRGRFVAVFDPATQTLVQPFTGDGTQTPLCPLLA